LLEDMEIQPEWSTESPLAAAVYEAAS
jgi:hypothetical protein